MIRQLLRQDPDSQTIVGVKSLVLLASWGAILLAVYAVVIAFVIFSIRFAQNGTLPTLGNPFAGIDPLLLAGGVAYLGYRWFTTLLIETFGEETVDQAGEEVAETQERLSDD